MNFLSPWFLLLLLIIPLLIAAYMWMLRRRRKFAVRYSSLSLIREALPKRSKWRQHVPFALFVLAICSMIISLARPAALVQVPLNRTTIILALDVSRSMCATDVEPNRLTVAQEAALAFIDDQADGTQIGIVAFADFAELVVPPTTDKELLRGGVENLTTALGTAIGSATLKSLDAISEINANVAPSGIDLEGSENNAGIAADYQPDIIVLLTDGANSRGPQPVDAAQQAVDRDVRVYTIGFGTDNPGQMICTREQLGANPSGPGSGSGGGGFGGGFGGGGGNFRQFLVIDEDTLQTVASMTGGDYYRAESAEQLYDIFLDLPTQIVLQEEALEISVVFAALGAVLALAAVSLSLKWNRYP
ncbi:MAG: VWA domain-containing protein [Anaerolineae bacterium]|nr:VWA domain-containing protein [Anaerolineae bacterium]